MKASLTRTVISPPPSRRAGLPLLSAQFIPHLIVCLLLAPAAVGSTEETRLTREDVCKVGFTTMRTPIACVLTATASITVGACDPQNCTLTSEGSARGTAGHQGYLAAETRVAADTGTSASICLGPDEVNDNLGLPCERLCVSHSVGTETLCEGTTSIPMGLPRGTCTFAYVSSSYGYNGKVGSAMVSLSWHVCRANNDRITITPFG